jgi:diguanylate cyclase (GGDEF)-like protein
MSAAALALLAALALASADESALEARVRAIEEANVNAHWTRSAELIEALGADAAELSPEQRFRVDLVRTRNFALAGDLPAAGRAVRQLLRREAPPDLRLRALTLGINIATNAGELAAAFAWLEEGLALVEQVVDGRPRLLGMASYLYMRAGEEQGAFEYAGRALAAAQASGKPRELCLALSDYGHALRALQRYAEAGQVRHQQVAACEEAGDPIFVADGLRGVGLALLREGRAGESLAWFERALETFEQSGYTTGVRESRLHQIEARLAAGRLDAGEAVAVLDELEPGFVAEGHWGNVELLQTLRSRIEEGRGAPEAALASLRRALAARQRIEQEARALRLAFLQVQFDTRFKEQQIALLDSERQRQAAELAARRQTQRLQAVALASLVLLSLLLGVLLRRSSRERSGFRELSERDGLTGLANHQHTMALGRQAFDRAQVELAPFTAVMADIDRFKRINDRFGHAAGDAVLRHFGELLRQVLPAGAIIGRTGGEEFTVLMAASAEQVRFLIEEIRRRILPLEVFGSRIDYRLSFGLCQATEHHASLEELLRAADQALYQAKRSGRNCLIDAAELPEAQRIEPGLVVLDGGIDPNRHLSRQALGDLEDAERVYALGDEPALLRLRDLRPDTRNLGLLLTSGISVPAARRLLVEALLEDLRAGYRVCAVFQNRPGGIEGLAQAALQAAREAGFSARAEPGVDLTACLLADLGLDARRTGLQVLPLGALVEAERTLDPLGLVVITFAIGALTLSARRRLVGRLLLDYPAAHPSVLYAPAASRLAAFQVERHALATLVDLDWGEHEALLLVPLGDPGQDIEARVRAALDAQSLRTR